MNRITSIGYICLILSIGHGLLGAIPENIYDAASFYLVMGKDLRGRSISEVDNGNPKIPDEDKVNTPIQSSINQADDAFNAYGLEIASKKKLQHLTFTGKIKGRGNVIVYLGLNTVTTSAFPQSNESIVTTVHGFYVESGRYFTKPLLGEFKGTNLQSAVESQKVHLYELEKKSTQVITNRIMTLSKGKRYWYASGPGMVMRFLPYKLKSTEHFNYNRRRINPQSLFIMLEKVQGYNLAVNLRTRNDRPFKTDGNWHMVNLEYGYVRYQILGQQGNVWTIATEIDKADGNPPMVEIIKVVRVDNILALAEIVDNDRIGYSKLDSGSLEVSETSLFYHKSYSEKGVFGLLKGLHSYAKVYNLDSALLPMMEDSVEDELGTDLCNSCARITVQYQYDFVTEILLPHKVISEPASEVTSSEAGFQTFVQEVHDVSPIVSTLGELEKLLTLWSSMYYDLP